jgi:hypothetical protein
MIFYKNKKNQKQTVSIIDNLTSKNFSKYKTN